MAQAAPSRATEPADDRRLPPHDLDAEMSVLGAMMMQPKVIDSVDAIVQPDDFWLGSHSTIYRAIISLRVNGKPTDLIAVNDKLAEQASEIGKGQLAQIAAYPTAASNVVHHARIVHDHATLRALIAAGQEIVRLGHERGAPATELVAQARTLLDGIAA